MAEEKVVKILEIKLDVDELNKKGAKTAGLLVDLKNKQKALKKENQEGSVEYQKLTNDIKRVTTVQQKNQKAIKDNTTATKAAKGSNEELRAQLSLQTAAYNKLGKEQRDNTKQGKELRASIKATSDELKKNESAVGDNRREVGNYSEAMTEALGNVGLFSQAQQVASAGQKAFGLVTQSVTNAVTLQSGALSKLTITQKATALATGLGTTAMKLFRLALISTGIGALIVALGSVVAWFTKTKEGVEAVKKGMAALGAAVSVIIDRFSSVAESMALIFSGKFKEGFSKLGESMSGVGKEIKKETEAAWKLTDALQDVVDKERALGVEKAKSRKEIERLKFLGDDITKTDQQRIKFTKQANELEVALQNKSVALATERVRIMKEQIGLGNSLEEDLQALADAETALANVDQESFTIRTELNNKLNALRKGISDAKIKATADEAKADTDAAKIKATADKEALDRLKEIKEFNQEVQLAQLDANAKELESNKIKYDNLLIQLITFNLSKEEEEIARAEIEKAREFEKTEIIADQLEKQTSLAATAAAKQLDLDKKKSDAIYDNASSVAGGLKGLLKEGSDEYKAAAIAEVTISTIRAAQGAFQQGISTFPPPAGPVLGAAMAGLAIASGLANVSKIASAQDGALWFGDGGQKSGMFSGPSHTSGGIKGVFSDGTNVEVEGNEAFVVVNKKDTPLLNYLNNINSIHGQAFLGQGGSVFLQDGGATGRGVSAPVINQLESARQLEQIMANMPPTIVLVDDIDDGLSRKATIENEATL